MGLAHPATDKEMVVEARQMLEITDFPAEVQKRLKELEEQTVEAGSK